MIEILSRGEFEDLKSPHHNQALLTIEALHKGLNYCRRHDDPEGSVVEWLDLRHLLRRKGWIK